MIGKHVLDTDAETARDAERKLQRGRVFPVLDRKDRLPRHADRRGKVFLRHLACVEPQAADGVPNPRYLETPAIDIKLGQIACRIAKCPDGEDEVHRCDDLLSKRKRTDGPYHPDGRDDPLHRPADAGYRPVTLIAGQIRFLTRHHPDDDRHDNDQHDPDHDTCPHQPEHQHGPDLNAVRPVELPRCVARHQIPQEQSDDHRIGEYLGQDIALFVGYVLMR